MSKYIHHASKEPNSLEYAVACQRMSSFLLEAGSSDYARMERLLLKAVECAEFLAHRLLQFHVYEDLGILYMSWSDARKQHGLGGSAQSRKSENYFEKSRKIATELRSCSLIIDATINTCSLRVQNVSDALTMRRIQSIADAKEGKDCFPLPRVGSLADEEHLRETKKVTGAMITDLCAAVTLSRMGGFKVSETAAFDTLAEMYVFCRRLFRDEDDEEVGKFFRQHSNDRVRVLLSSADSRRSNLAVHLLNENRKLKDSYGLDAHALCKTRRKLADVYLELQLYDQAIEACDQLIGEAELFSMDDDVEAAMITEKARQDIDFCTAAIKTQQELESLLVRLTPLYECTPSSLDSSELPWKEEVRLRVRVFRLEESLELDSHKERAAMHARRAFDLLQHRATQPKGLRNPEKDLMVSCAMYLGNWCLAAPTPLTEEARFFFTAAVKVSAEDSVEISQLLLSLGQLLWPVISDGMVDSGGDGKGESEVEVEVEGEGDGNGERKAATYLPAAQQRNEALTHLNSSCRIASSLGESEMELQCMEEMYRRVRGRREYASREADLKSKIDVMRDLVGGHPPEQLESNRLRSVLDAMDEEESLGSTGSVGEEQSERERRRLREKRKMRPSGDEEVDHHPYSSSPSLRKKRTPSLASFPASRSDNHRRTSKSRTLFGGASTSSSSSALPSSMSKRPRDSLSRRASNSRQQEPSNPLTRMWNRNATGHTASGLKRQKANNKRDTNKSRTGNNSSSANPFRPSSRSRSSKTRERRGEEIDTIHDDMDGWNFGGGEYAHDDHHRMMEVKEDVEDLPSADDLRRRQSLGKEKPSSTVSTSSSSARHHSRNNSREEGHPATSSVIKTVSLSTNRDESASASSGSDISSVVVKVNDLRFRILTPLPHCPRKQGDNRDHVCTLDCLGDEVARRYTASFQQSPVVRYLSFHGEVLGMSDGLVETLTALRHSSAGGNVTLEAVVDQLINRECSPLEALLMQAEIEKKYAEEVKEKGRALIAILEKEIRPSSLMLGSDPDPGLSLPLCLFFRCLHRTSPLYSSLVRIDLSGCGLGDAGALALASCCSSFVSNNVGSGSGMERDGSDGAIQQTLVPLSGLCHLSLDYCEVTRTGVGPLLDALATLSDLRSLSLRGNQLGDSCVASLDRLCSRSRSLQHLDISCCGMSCESDEASRLSLILRGCTSLTSLSLEGNPLMEGTLRHILSSSSLPRLDLSHITSGSIRTGECIEKHLLQLTSLPHASGRGMAIGGGNSGGSGRGGDVEEEDDQKWLHLSLAGWQDTKTHHLAVLSRAMREGLCPLTSLDVSSARDVVTKHWSEFLSSLSMCTTLRHVRLDGIPILRETDAKSLSFLLQPSSHLTHISLVGCSLTLPLLKIILRNALPLTAGNRVKRSTALEVHLTGNPGVGLFKEWVLNDKLEYPLNAALHMVGDMSLCLLVLGPVT